MACSLVDKYPIFVGMSYCRLHGRKKFIILSWSCRQDVPLTCWYVYKTRHTTEDINLNSFCRLSVSLLLQAVFYTQESFSVVSSENKTLTKISGFHTAEVANNWIKFINEELHKPYSSRDLLRWLNQKCHSIGSSHDVRFHIHISTRRRGILTEVFIFLLRNSRHVRIVPHIRPWPLRSKSFPYHCSLIIMQFNIMLEIQLKPNIDAQEAKGHKCEHVI